MAIFPIRVFGDPVLRQRAAEVNEIDGKIVRLSEEMIETMRDAPGVGLAAPQVGIERRIFVYDVGEGAQTVINPEIVEASGEWEYEEGCLSVPDLHWTIVRPKEVHLVGRDLEGNEVSIEADELLRAGLPTRARPSERHPAPGASGQGPAQTGDARAACPGTA